MSILQVRVHGVDDVRIDSVDRPTVTADDALVEVSLCGICGSDLGYIAMGGLGLTQPMPLGHELAGTIVELGEHVRHLSVGDRVVVNPMAHANSIGNGGPEGAFSPYLLVRGAAVDHNTVLRIPDSLTIEQGALVEPLSVALHGCHQGQASPGDRAVVFGAGPIGLCAVVCLHDLGLQDIVVVDLADYRLSVAEQLGAIPFKAGSADLMAFLRDRHGEAELMGMPVPATDLYLEATGARAVFEQVVNMARTGARLVVLGLHKESVQLDLANVLLRELNIVGSMAYPTEFPDVIAMLENGNIDVDPLITHRYPLSQFADAVVQARNTETSIKVLVDCQR
jgi:2-desacetyl-2-hydroxyethyl bacteriochlorophyllide A dehydrogenase